VRPISIGRLAVGSVAAAVLALGVPAAGAQMADAPMLELRPYAGAWIPTGDARDRFDDEPILGAQLALQVRPRTRLVGGIGLVPAEADYSVTDRAVTIVQVDAGLEWDFARAIQWARLRPFLGLGAGGRSYLYGDGALKDRTCLAGHGAVGSDARIGPTKVRFEVRGNVYCFKFPVGGAQSRTRSDLTIAVGLPFRVW
jgi:hypothetical protein